MAALARLPLFLVLWLAACLSMLAPAAFALWIGDFHDARSFFYASVLGTLVAAFSGLALSGRQRNTTALRQLAALLVGFVALPVLLAIPLHDAMRNTRFLSAYFEMVSAFTTTGATLFEAARLSGPEHLWRAQVGWLGGLVMWIAAAAILAPLSIGGFEVTATGEPGQSRADGHGLDRAADPVHRLWRSAGALTPVYASLTLGLVVLLLAVGEPPLVAISHAMGVMATSGISPLPDAAAGSAGLAGEALMFAFLIFALSRLTFSRDTSQGREGGLRVDPEFRLGLLIVAVVPVVLFLRHWAAAFEVGDEQNLLAGLRALWGGLFTALSFLSTTGYVSADWVTAQSWSGLSTPGLILMGLALVGGGVATTAGGVKLMRVYALYLTGAREIERLVHPHSIGSSAQVSRRIRRSGGFIAWVFFMLFAIMLALMSVTLGLLGLDFETAMTLTVAMLTNTGPLTVAALAEPVGLLGLSDPVKLVLCLGMVLGRLELLALVVMLTPDGWRD